VCKVWTAYRGSEHSDVHDLGRIFLPIVVFVGLIVLELQK
jgi:hypothetical protein